MVAANGTDQATAVARGPEYLHAPHPTFTEAVPSALSSAGDLGPMFMDWDPAGTGLSGNFGIPDMLAKSDDWAFQGVDTTFWSLLREGVNPGTYNGGG